MNEEYNSLKSINIKDYKSLYYKYKNKYLKLKNKMKGGETKYELIKRFEIEGRGQGLILGHGNQINDEFCLIPDNIILRPTSRIGSYSTTQYLEDDEDVEFLFKRKDRQYISNFLDGYSNYYLPGSLIPNMNIKLRSVFNKDGTTIPETYSFTGVVTGNIVCNHDSYYQCLYQDYQDEETTKIKSFEFSNQEIISKENWGNIIKLSSLLKIISDKIKKNKEGNIIPKIYILQVCRSGCDSISFDTLSKCFDGEIPDEYLPVPNLMRIPSVSEVKEFVNFKNDFDKIKSNIKTRNSEFLDRFIPNFVNDLRCKSEQETCVGPLINKCDNNIKCRKTCALLIRILDIILNEIESSVEIGEINYKTFCLLNHLKLNKIPIYYIKEYNDLLKEC